MVRKLSNYKPSPETEQCLQPRRPFLTTTPHSHQDRPFPCLCGSYTLALLNHPCKHPYKMQFNFSSF